MKLWRVTLLFPKQPGRRKALVRAYVTLASTASAARAKVRREHAAIYMHPTPWQIPKEGGHVQEVATGVFLTSVYTQ